MHTQELKQEARRLRSQGYSLKDIAKSLSIAKSTASKWVIDIELGPSALSRIQTKREQGRRNSFSSMQLKRKRIYDAISNIVKQDVYSLTLDRLTARLLCSFLYWAEGGKTESLLRFTNSDPVMVQTFLALLRAGFKIDEAKFGATLHLHDYHNDQKQLQFWSKITRIPEQRIGIYRKPHTGINKRPGYPGCICLNYYDIRIFKALVVYYTFFAQIYGGLV